MKSNKKKRNTNKSINMKILIAFILGAIISVTSSYAIAETLINSKDVSYVDNAKLGATNVQAAIDGTCTKFSTELQSFLLKVYPVGSIYISYNNTNPGTLFGGTWEIIGDGRVLKGISSGTAGTTGGSSTVTLSMSNIPAHTHDISHTHTTKAASITDGKTSNTTSSWSVEEPSGVDGSEAGANITLAYEGAIEGNTYTSNGPYMFWKVRYNNVHSHTVTGTIPSLSTDSISTATSGSAGSSNPTAINVQDPYLTVYMWKRKS